MSEYIDLTSYELHTWQELSEKVFTDLNVNKFLNRIIVLLVGIIAALSILTIMRLIINERKYEIGVIFAIGAKAKDVFFIFFYESIIVGFLGSMIGVIISYLTSQYFIIHGICVKGLGERKMMPLGETLYAKLTPGNIIFTTYLLYWSAPYSRGNNII